MKTFKSLRPSGLPPTYDRQNHGGEPFVRMKETDQGLVINYIFPGFFITDDRRDIDNESKDFLRLNIPGAGHQWEGGKALMPTFGRYVQIPANADFELIVEKGDPEVFEDVLVYPAQTLETDNEEEDPFEFNQAFYETDTLYPEQLAEVSGPYRMEGYHALLVHVRPLQFNPAKKQVIGYSNIEVKIKVNQRGEDSDPTGNEDPGLHQDAYDSLFLNPKSRLERKAPWNVNEIAKVPFYKIYQNEYLIIYHKDLEVAAQKLADWKNTRGLVTEAVPLSKISKKITVNAIKKYIRKRRGSFFSNLRYVLLMGDVNLIPSEDIPDGLFGQNTTDYYYSTQSDPVDKNDLKYPWLSIGRIPVSLAADAELIVDKIIQYEKYPPCDPKYYERMTFGAYFQDDNPQDGKADRGYMHTMEKIRTHLEGIGHDVERVYVSNNPNPQEYYDGTPVPADVKAAIVDDDLATSMMISTTSEGQLITGHRDHGGTSGWSHPSFKKDDLDAILSGYLSIFYSVNCLTGRFDSNPTDSFAEKILKINGGSPSLIAATRLSHTWLNNDLMEGMFDAMWPGVLPAFPGAGISYPVKHNRLGDILNYAKSYLPIANNWPYGLKDHFEIYHVIGDPTLELWKAMPPMVTMTVRHFFNSMIVKLSALPEGSVVTVWEKDKLIQTIHPVSTIFWISLREWRLAKKYGRRGRVFNIYFKAPGYRLTQERLALR